MDSRMLIGGQWTAASEGAVLPVVSPATGAEIARVPRGTRADVGRAVEAARRAQPAFGRLTAFERAKLCHRIADVVRSRREDLARYLSLEQGKPYEAEALGGGLRPLRRAGADIDGAAAFGVLLVVVARESDVDIVVGLP